MGQGSHRPSHDMLASLPTAQGDGHAHEALDAATVPRFRGRLGRSLIQM